MVGPQVDIALVEAGLGGARDATNVFEPAQLKAAILTAVGLEHQAALGERHKSRTSRSTLQHAEVTRQQCPHLDTWNRLSPAGFSHTAGLAQIPCSKHASPGSSASAWLCEIRRA
jgi:hypothetical protein